MARTVDRHGRTSVEWRLDTADVVDGEYLARYGHELVDVASLRIGPARFDTVDTLDRVLKPTLTKIDFSFFEVGAVAGAVGRHSRSAATEALSLLGRLEGLTDLDLAWCYALGDEAVGEIAKLKRLKSLTLETEMTDRGLEQLGALGRLEVFDSTCSFKITGSGFKSWPHMPHLRAIILSQCTSVGDAALAVVEKAPNLDYLVLNGCKKLTPGALSRLKGGPKLDTLELRGLELDLDTIRALRKNNPTASLGCDLEHLPQESRLEAGALLEP